MSEFASFESGRTGLKDQSCVVSPQVQFAATPRTREEGARDRPATWPWGRGRGRGHKHLKDLRWPALWPSPKNWDFPKLGVPFLMAPIIRTIVFGVCIGVPLFWETTKVLVLRDSDVQRGQQHLHAQLVL